MDCDEVWGIGEGRGGLWGNMNTNAEMERDKEKMEEVRDLAEWENKNGICGLPDWSAPCQKKRKKKKGNGLQDGRGPML